MILCCNALWSGIVCDIIILSEPPSRTGDVHNDFSSCKVVNSEITGRIEAYSVNMQQQNGINDCGLFAIACAFELANNK